MKEWVKTFPWESTEQRQGFDALQKWVGELPANIVHGFGFYSTMACVAAWFIQKDHESNEWWSNTVAEQVGQLENQVRLLQDRITELEKRSPLHASL
jgi:hypothetical protein